MDKDIIKEVVKDEINIWQDMKVHFIIYEKMFVKAFATYNDFKKYVLDDCFFINHLEEPYLATIEDYSNKKTVISNHKISRRYEFIQEDKDNG